MTKPMKARIDELIALLILHKLAGNKITQRLLRSLSQSRNFKSVFANADFQDFILRKPAVLRG